MSQITRALAAALFALFSLGVFVSTGPWKTPAEVSFGVLHALGLGEAQPPVADGPRSAGQPHPDGVVLDAHRPARHRLGDGLAQRRAGTDVELPLMQRALDAVAEHEAVR